MSKGRSSVRRRSSIAKVRTKKKKMVPACQRFQHSALDYDDKKSQFSNYARLGLLADANQIGAASVSITGFKPRVKVPDAGPSEAAGAAGPSGAAPHPLELEVGEALKVVRAVPPGERTVLCKLLAKYGDDGYARMARDMKLNAMQHTAAHLRGRIAKMRAEDEEDAAAAADAAAKDEPPPQPRHERKITKHPNVAFKKRSMHFT